MSPRAVQAVLVALLMALAASAFALLDRFRARAHEPAACVCPEPPPGSCPRGPQS